MGGGETEGVGSDDGDEEEDDEDDGDEDDEDDCGSDEEGFVITVVFVANEDLGMETRP